MPFGPASMDLGAPDVDLKPSEAYFQNSEGDLSEDFDSNKSHTASFLGLGSKVRRTLYVLLPPHMETQPLSLWHAALRGPGS